MPRMSLRSTINWLITLVMLLFIMSLAALQIDSSRRSTAAEMEAATGVTVQMLANLVNSRELPGGLASPQVLVDFLGMAGRIRAHDIRVQDAAGRVLYDSPLSPYKAGRSAPQWFSRLVAPQTSVTTLPLD